MSIRNLDSLFDPASVAVVGASDRPGSVGATVWRNLRQGGFSGTRYAMALGGPRWLGAVTPVGGVALIAGFAWMALRALQVR